MATPYNLNMAPNKMVTYSHTSFHRYDDDDDDDDDTTLQSGTSVAKWRIGSAATADVYFAFFSRDVAQK